MSTKQELRDYCKKHGIKGFYKLNKVELEKLVNKHKHTGKCLHEFKGKKDITISSGIVFVIYECEKCGEEFDQGIGETWPPNKYGKFE